jgi:hypothetical protein
MITLAKKFEVVDRTHAIVKDEMQSHRLDPETLDYNPVEIWGLTESALDAVVKEREKAFHAIPKWVPWRQAEREEAYFLWILAMQRRASLRGLQVVLR